MKTRIPLTALAFVATAFSAANVTFTSYYNQCYTDAYYKSGFYYAPEFTSSFYANDSVSLDTPTMNFSDDYRQLASQGSAHSTWSAQKTNTELHMSSYLIGLTNCQNGWGNYGVPNVVEARASQYSEFDTDSATSVYLNLFKIHFEVGAPEFAVIPYSRVSYTLDGTAFTFNYQSDTRPVYAHFDLGAGQHSFYLDVYSYTETGEDLGDYYGVNSYSQAYTQAQLDVTTTATPEPATFVACGLGLAILRRKKAQ